jgi:hypothetical protein
MPGVEVTIDWKPTADVPDRIRRKVNRLVRSLGPVLNEYEANLFDMTNLASNGLDYLMPKIELSLPLYEENCAFRVRMTRVDLTRIFLETKDGEPVAEVFLI